MSNYLFERYKASMILSGVGDALGYRNGIWLYNNSGKDIYREFIETFQQIEHIHIQLPQWRLSDNSILHLAIGECLSEYGEKDPSSELYSSIVKKLKSILNDLKNRHPNSNQISSINRLSENDWSQPYSPISNDCKSAVRSISIGLRYSKISEFDKLMNVSIEISRMTNSHLEDKPINTWIKSLIQILPYLQHHIQSQQGSHLTHYIKSWSSFEKFWKDFIIRQDVNIKDMEERDNFYRSLSHAGWPGSSGCDSIAIAYNALITSDCSWSELCKRSCFHTGQTNSTGSIAAGLFGIIYGFQYVPIDNYKNIEYHDRLENVAIKLFDLREKEIKSKQINDQHGPCQHFKFVPSNILDNIPGFRQSILSTNQRK
ncbi:unnamed protein product [Rotaria sordida]|uniref:ADP-ribosylhydrolase ARH1 n=1 Tax=Rotaria sordida TaxID=392033 RepID=A0A815EEE0_9BILA|nr:unnamed protein product [Rotaria sordida]